MCEKDLDGTCPWSEEKSRLVGPVGFEPTTSGPKTLISQGRQRPRLTARTLRSGILLAEIVFPDQVAQRVLENLF
ncbi:MAG: hypothetical protein ABSF82_06930 [Candidatus Bathyarchaeia archaeon]